MGTPCYIIRRVEYNGNEESSTTGDNKESGTTQENGKDTGNTSIITNAWLCDDAITANGQQVYLQFSHSHDGTFGAVINPDGLAKLKGIYGVTAFNTGNENNVYTSAFH